MEKKVTFSVRQTMGGIASIVVTAVLMRFPFLGIESLWTDEVVTIRDSLASVSTIITQRWDPHPPLYYLLMHVWLKLGNGDAFVRVPAALFGVLSVWVGYLAAKRLFTKEIAYVFALLLAVTPLHIWYSQETRMYSMLLFWALLSTLFLVMLLQGNHKVGALIGYILATALGLYTHYTFFILLIAQNMVVTAYWAVVRKRSISLWTWLVTQLIVALLYLPWLPNLPGHWAIIRASTDYPLWILSTNPFLIGFVVLITVGWIITFIWFKELFGTPTRVVSPRLKQLLLYGSLSLSWLIYVAYMALAMTNRLTTLKRQTLILFPFFCLAVIVFTTYLPNWKRWAGILIAVSFMAALVNNFTLQKPPWREVISLIESQSDDSDVVVVSPNWLKGEVEYYITEGITVEGGSLEAAPSQANTLLTNYEKVWLISNTKFEQHYDPQHVVVNEYLTHQVPRERFDFGEIEVLLFIE